MAVFPFFSTRSFLLVELLICSRHTLQATANNNNSTTTTTTTTDTYDNEALLRSLKVIKIPAAATGRATPFGDQQHVMPWWRHNFAQDYSTNNNNDYNLAPSSGGSTPLLQYTASNPWGLGAATAERRLFSIQDPISLTLDSDPSASSNAALYSQDELPQASLRRQQQQFELLKQQSRQRFRKTDTMKNALTPPTPPGSATISLSQSGGSAASAENSSSAAANKQQFANQIDSPTTIATTTPSWAVNSNNGTKELPQARKNIQIKIKQRQGNFYPAAPSYGRWQQNSGGDGGGNNFMISMSDDPTTTTPSRVEITTPDASLPSISTIEPNGAQLLTGGNGRFPIPVNNNNNNSSAVDSINISIQQQKNNNNHGGSNGGQRPFAQLVGEVNDQLQQNNNNNDWHQRPISYGGNRNGNNNGGYALAAAPIPTVQMNHSPYANFVESSLPDLMNASSAEQLSSAAEMPTNAVSSLYGGYMNEAANNNMADSTVSENLLLQALEQFISALESAQKDVAGGAKQKTDETDASRTDEAIDMPAVTTHHACEASSSYGGNNNNYQPRYRETPSAMAADDDDEDEDNNNPSDEMLSNSEMAMVEKAAWADPEVHQEQMSPSTMDSGDAKMSSGKTHDGYKLTSFEHDTKSPTSAPGNKQQPDLQVKPLLAALKALKNQLQHKLRHTASTANYVAALSSAPSKDDDDDPMPAVADHDEKLAPSAYGSSQPRYRHKRLRRSRRRRGGNGGRIRWMPDVASQQSVAGSYGRPLVAAADSSSITYRRPNFEPDAHENIAGQQQAAPPGGYGPSPSSLVNDKPLTGTLFTSADIPAQLQTLQSVMTAIVESMKKTSHPIKNKNRYATSPKRRPTEDTLTTNMEPPTLNDHRQRSPTSSSSPPYAPSWSDDDVSLPPSAKQKKTTAAVLLRPGTHMWWKKRSGKSKDGKSKWGSGVWSVAKVQPSDNAADSSSNNDDAAFGKPLPRRPAVSHRRRHVYGQHSPAKIRNEPILQQQQQNLLSRVSTSSADKPKRSADLARSAVSAGSVAERLQDNRKLSAILSALVRALKLSTTNGAAPVNNRQHQQHVAAHHTPPLYSWFEDNKTTAPETTWRDGLLESRSNVMSQRILL